MRLVSQLSEINTIASIQIQAVVRGFLCRKRLGLLAPKIAPAASAAKPTRRRSSASAARITVASGRRLKHGVEVDMYLIVGKEEPKTPSASPSRAGVSFRLKVSGPGDSKAISKKIAPARLCSSENPFFDPAALALCKSELSPDDVVVAAMLRPSAGIDAVVLVGSGSPLSWRFLSVSDGVVSSAPVEAPELVDGSSNPFVQLAQTVE